jgi:hypothetical protein
MLAVNGGVTAASLRMRIRTELVATRWRLRSGVGNWYVAPVQAFQTVKLSGLAGQSPLPDRSALNWQQPDGDCVLGRELVRFSGAGVSDC